MKKQLSLKHRWLDLENSVPSARSFSWTTGLAYFPPFTYFPFLLQLTSSSLFSLFLFLNLFLPVFHFLYSLSGLFYLYFFPFVLPLIHSTSLSILSIILALLPHYFLLLSLSLSLPTRLTFQALFSAVIHPLNPLFVSSVVSQRLDEQLVCCSETDTAEKQDLWPTAHYSTGSHRG